MKKFLNSFEDGICSIILFIMLILTFANVIARKFLVWIDPSLGSMPFVEELTCVGLMVLSILGAATASKRGAHPRPERPNLPAAQNRSERYPAHLRHTQRRLLRRHRLPRLPHGPEPVRQ